jgi:ABC-type branched-subunit amino acid transport system ATPase component
MCILENGGRWRNEQMKEYMRANFNRTFQNNTIAKNLSFLINDGLVLSGRTNGASYEYWLSDSQQQEMAL